MRRFCAFFSWACPLRSDVETRRMLARESGLRVTGPRQARAAPARGAKGTLSREARGVNRLVQTKCAASFDATPHGRFATG
jgi:hypothetical protein